MNKNLTIKMGNCNHRKYVPELIELVRAGAVSPANIISQIGELLGASTPTRRSISVGRDGTRSCWTRRQRDTATLPATTAPAHRNPTFSFSRRGAG